VRRSVIGFLTVLLLALLAFNWRRESIRATQLAQTRTIAPFDWSTATDRDLNIAAVFLTQRVSGVTRAMDSLQALAMADTTLRTDGHMIAHMLGRFAIAKNRNDPSILSECRPTFQAGCYHGVMEGYLASLPQVDGRAVAHLCSALERPDSSRFSATECAHGLGHGLLERLRYDLAGALGACDTFDDIELRTECHDGVFMENAVHSLGTHPMNMGNDVGGAAMRGMTHTPSNATGFRRSDPSFPCDSVASQYQPSCWAYQPLFLARVSNDDARKTLRACELAPDSSRANCYQGFGKQSMVWFGWNHDRVISVCETAGPQAIDCLKGGVEALVDLTLTADRAVAFCGAASERFRTACFADIGTRMSRIRSRVEEMQHDCASARTPAYVQACLRGATTKS